MLVRCRGVRRKVTATFGGPQRRELFDDAVCELIAGTGQAEGDVRMQALESGRARSRAPDTGFELGPQSTLLGVRARDTLRELRIGLERACPPVHPARGLQARH